MADVGTGSGGGASQGGNQGGGGSSRHSFDGGSGTPARPGYDGGNQSGYTGRSRISDFTNFSAGQTVPTHQQSPESRSQVIDRGEQNYDPFNGIGQDARAQALALADSDEGQGEFGEDGSELLGQDEQSQYDIWKRSHKQYEALQAGDDLPDDFADKFRTVMINGQRERRSVREIESGYMLQRDYSNAKREIAIREQQVEQREQGMGRLLADLDRPETFIDAMIAINKFKGFDAAARMYGKQLYAESKMSPEQREVVAMNRQLDARAKQLHRENMALQAQMQAAQQQQPAPGWQAVYDQLAQIFPKAAQRVGWEESELSQRLFEMHFERLHPDLRGSDITSEFVMTVMRAAQQEEDAVVAASRARRAREVVADPSAPPSANRGLSSAPPNRALGSQNGERLTSNGQKRSKIEDFGKAVKRAR